MLRASDAYFSELDFMLDIALKEWAIVCDLLIDGQLALLLRKGGIHESGGPGVFSLEHSRFLLFPSWLHQKPEMVKPAFRNKMTILSAEPAEVTFRGMGEVAKIWQVKNRAQIDALDDLHCWTPAQIDMRFNYKPENPLYLMAIRASLLPTARTVKNTAAYSGCRSWVPLSGADRVEESGARTAIDDDAFAKLLNRVEKTMA